MISPLLPSCWGSPLPLEVGISSKLLQHHAAASAPPRSRCSRAYRLVGASLAFIIFHHVQSFFWLVSGEVTGQCSRNLVLSLKLPPSTWVGTLVPTEELEGFVMYIPWAGTKALSQDCFTVSWLLLSSFCISSLPSWAEFSLPLKIVNDALQGPSTFFSDTIYYLHCNLHVSLSLSVKDCELIEVQGWLLYLPFLALSILTSRPKMGS